MVKILLIYLSTFLFASLQDCREKFPFNTEWKNTDFVFVAHVNSNPESQVHDAFGRIIIYSQLEIKEIFKGKYLGDESSIITILKYTVDDYTFEEGEDYLVFAEFTCSNTMLKVSKCSRTCKLEDAGNLLELAKKKSLETPKCEKNGTVEEIIKE